VLCITIFPHRSVLTPLIRELKEELVLIGKEIKTIICLKTGKVPCAEKETSKGENPMVTPVIDRLDFEHIRTRIEIMHPEEGRS
jgi:hypothetical protein